MVFKANSSGPNFKLYQNVAKLPYDLKCGHASNITTEKIKIGDQKEQLVLQNFRMQLTILSIRLTISFRKNPMTVTLWKVRGGSTEIPVWILILLGDELVEFYVKSAFLLLLKMKKGKKIKLMIIIKRPHALFLSNVAQHVRTRSIGRGILSVDAKIFLRLDIWRKVVANKALVSLAVKRWHSCIIFSISKLTFFPLDINNNSGCK